ncbi:glycosyl hydrolase family 10 [Fusarium agapanthi]|uniref:endo-1,4-beta-xylanase n=1 Tax=Fusarium agapanthi TaxID=1803897 RepID=A0A9P5AYR2_9HYPO|nr:glycosyl hydrolase family 10 [Fusarium agapanthi]
MLTEICLSTAAMLASMTNFDLVLQLTCCILRRALKLTHVITLKLHNSTHTQKTSTDSTRNMRLTTIIGSFVAFAKAISIPSTGTTSLTEEAAKKNLLFGSGAINPAYLNDSQFRAILSKQFNSLSLENELKFGLDNLVKFADANNVKVKGHGLLSLCCNPDYILNITSPGAVRAEITNHIEAIMHRYRDQQQRFVIEPLYETLGPSWVEHRFRIAQEADPYAKLFLNENLVEAFPLMGSLCRCIITLEPLVPGVIREMVESYRALGLEVTIAEMDVHTYNATQQVEMYGSTIKEALDAGITDISFWGFTDKHAYTWLQGAKPLMFNETYYPKSAFYATHSALINFNERS